MTVKWKHELLWKTLMHDFVCCSSLDVCYFSWRSYCDHIEGFELLLVLSGVMYWKRSLLKSLFCSSDLWRAVIACDVNQVFLPEARVYQLNAAGESSLHRNEVVWVTSDKRAIEVILSSGEKMTGMLWLQSCGWESGQNKGIVLYNH